MNRYLYRNHKGELTSFPNCHLVTHVPGFRVRTHGKNSGLKIEVSEVLLFMPVSLNGRPQLNKKAVKLGLIIPEVLAICTKYDHPISLRLQSGSFSGFIFRIL